MLNCKEVARICSDELERRLKLGEQASLQLHLRMCTGCTHYRRQMKTLRQIMQAYAEGRAPEGEASGDDRALP